MNVITCNCNHAFLNAFNSQALLFASSIIPEGTVGCPAGLLGSGRLCSKHEPSTFNVLAGPPAPGQLTLQAPTLLGPVATVTEQVAEHVGHTCADERHVQHRPNPNTMATATAAAAAAFSATSIVVSS